TFSTPEPATPQARRRPRGDTPAAGSPSGKPLTEHPSSESLVTMNGPSDRSECSGLAFRQTPCSNGKAAAMSTQHDAPTMGELLKDAPKNWGNWGSDDEVGALNYLGADEVLRGLRYVKSGQVFTLQIPMGHPHGDPVFPGREGTKRENVLDESSWDEGREGAPDFPGGLHYSDDKAEIFLQGSTQYDALGHVW